MSLDLSPGSVLHIKDFSSRGHPAKNKYVVIIGSTSEAIAVGFLISSQLAYLTQEPHRNEVVRIPHNATTFLRAESIIQCFEMEYLSAESLTDGFDEGSVRRVGKLLPKYLHRIRIAVEGSYLLPQRDIEIALRLLPKASP
jgi:hypothetical protein